MFKKFVSIVLACVLLVFASVSVSAQKGDNPIYFPVITSDEVPLPAIVTPVPLPPAINGIVSANALTNDMLLVISVSGSFMTADLYDVYGAVYPMEGWEVGEPVQKVIVANCVWVVAVSEYGTTVHKISNIWPEGTECIK